MGNKTGKPDPVEVIAAALRAFGELTAANVAKKTAMAYPTVTPKLRALEETGRAERVKRDSQTFWRLVTPTAPTPATDADTDTGDATGEFDQDPTATAQPPAQTDAPVDQPVPAVTNPGIADTEPADGTDTAPNTDVGPTTGSDNADAGSAATSAPDTVPAPDPDPEPEASNATPDAQTDGGAQAAQPVTDTAPATPVGGKTRRPSGALGRTALKIMKANPDTAYTVGEIAKLIDRADAADGHNYPKASPGAVVLACDALVTAGDSTRVNDKPATYQLAAPPPTNP